jgi:hypothetical protein
MIDIGIIFVYIIGSISILSCGCTFVYYIYKKIKNNKKENEVVEKYYQL